MKNSFLVVMLALLPAVSHSTLIDPSRYDSLTSDRRAKKIGDLLTVVVSESTLATSSAGFGASSESDFSFKGNTLTSTGNLGFGLDGGTENKGETSRKGQIRTTVTTRVISEGADGVLQIQGEQNVTINNDQQRIKISGFIRPDDIAYDNTVYSYRLYKAKIEIVGQGGVQEAQRPNIFYRMLKWTRIL